MGWLLTIWLTLPPVETDLEIRMWFSRQSYCRLAKEKFVEKPMRLKTNDGRRGVAQVAGAECRELRKDEAALIPRHMRRR